MHKLEKLILEAFASVKQEQEEREATITFKNLDPKVQKSIEARYGVSPDPSKDFVSKDLTTLYRYIKPKGDNEGGGIDHKVIKLPSFEKLYINFSDIVQDIKKLMGSKDVRQDQAARELFELIKTNFRKVQRYLRTERPEQYELMKMRRTLSEMIEDLKRHESVILEEKKYLNESLLDQINEEEPQPEEEPDTSAPEETVLEDATDKILGKFPTVKAAIIKLQTEDFKEFVESIDWISPRPSSFRINLKNGQDYILKWTGKTFEAQILGKRYLLSNIAEYQQALDKLAILYREAPMTGAGEGEPADTDTGGGGGGGEFPGDDAAGGGEEIPEPDDVGGEEGGEEGGADLSGEPIDFEEPGEEPEA
jgi:hypothetical protein